MSFPEHTERRAAGSCSDIASVEHHITKRQLLIKRITGKAAQNCYGDSQNIFEGHFKRCR
jgi:hypothetical protein